MNKRVFWFLLLARWLVAPAHAYIEREFHLAEVVEQSTNILVAHVKSVDMQAGKIIYEVDPDGYLKGAHEFKIIQDYLLTPGGIHSQAIKILKLVKPGDLCVMFYQDENFGYPSEKHVAGLWYQTHGQGAANRNSMWWYFVHEEIYLDRTFYGKTEDLLKILPSFMKGETVQITRVFSKTDKSVCTALIDNQSHGIPSTMKFLPVKAREVIKGKQFGQQIILPGTAGPGRGCTWIDYDLDGRLDAYLCNADGSHLFHQNSDSAWEETTREVGLGPASAVGVWADYAGNGRPSLLTSSSPPRLFTNLPTGRFRDDGAYYLPKLPRYNVGGVAWIDYNGDGRPDILLANAQYGIALFENLGHGRERFRDISDAVGLGEKVGASGNFLTTASVSSKRAPDFLYNSAAGLLYIYDGKKFVPKQDAGIKYETAPRVGVVWGDFDNDGNLDLFVPQDGRSRLFKNDGAGKFTDVTEKSGDIAKNTTDRSVCACWGDFNNDGLLDLFVGNIGQPNRLYINKGDGTFSDQTNEFGLGEITYDTTAAVAADFDHNGTLDLLINNLGQNSIIFVNDLKNSSLVGVTFQFKGGSAIGATLEARGRDGKLLAFRQINGGSGFGSQEPLEIFLALPKGENKIAWSASNGRSSQKTINVTLPTVITLDLPQATSPAAPKQGLREQKN